MGHSGTEINYDVCELRRTMPEICVEEERREEGVGVGREVSNYGAGLKIYRLFEEELYRVDENAEPDWDDFDDEPAEGNMIEKQELIENAKEETLKNKDDKAIVNMKYFVHLYCLILLAIATWNGVSEVSISHEDKSVFL